MAESNKNSPNIHVLIMAAGSGQRFGGDLPKQYLPIHGKSVLRHSVDKFLNLEELKSLRVIIDPDYVTQYQSCVNDLNLQPHIRGGKTRKESVYNGLMGLDEVNHKDIILVHDAARPCVNEPDICKLIQTVKENCKAATLSAEITDTLRRSEDLTNQELIERENLHGIQTPQAFHYETLLKAHKTAAPDKNYTDDTGLVLAMGEEVRLVPGSKSNIKITTKEDWDMAEKLLAPQAPQIRTGLGFDVHAFEENAGKPLILCGIEIDHKKTLKGHSDADVGLHAITDALLGTIGAGDIGDHFPPSNPDFKDMDSAIFLKKAHDLIREKKGQIVNIDLTLVCETPKIGPYKDAMQTRIAEILEIEPARINVKATTTEELGFTGRKEGIAAQAVASVSLRE